MDVKEKNKNKVYFDSEFGGTDNVLYSYGEALGWLKRPVICRVSNGIIKVRGITTRTATTIYFCHDTHKRSPSIFMLEDDIWNAITPDFDKDERGISRGMLSIGACDERAKKHLGRSLNKEDFKADDYRNDALLYVFNMLK